jgi:hypothetical protein
MNLLFASIPVLFIALSCSVSNAQPIRGGWTICTRDLQLRNTLIERANERELTLINTYGIRSVLPMDQVLFIVKAESVEERSADEVVGVPRPEANPVRLISLVDGQSIRGSVLESERIEQLSISVIAGNSVYGDAFIELEHLLSVRDQHLSEEHIIENLIDDVVVMRNGDRISGFIESIGSQIEIAVDDRIIQLDLERAQRVYVANDPDPVNGIYMRFVDDEVIRVLGFDFAARSPISISIDPGSLGLDNTGSTDWRFDPGMLEALWVDEADQRVLALCEITPESIEPMGDRIWVPTPDVINLDASHEALQTIDFQSPARVRYAMPEGARRFACTIEAPIELWTDCVVRILADRDGRLRQVFEQRLNPETPTAGVNVELPPGTGALVVEIDPGEHGPIQDRVLMHRPRVLLSN